MDTERKWVKDNERFKQVTIGTGHWRNFSGEKTDANKTGRRVFNIFLPEDLANELKEIGWNVKSHDPYKPDGDTTYTLEIEVSYDTKDGKFPVPIVKMVSYDGVETLLNEETIGMLDRADIEEAEVEFRPNNWSVNGRTGCKAYLHELKVYLRQPRRARSASLRNREEEDDF